jgi:hypothetical protein
LTRAAGTRKIGAWHGPRAPPSAARVPTSSTGAAAAREVRRRRPKVDVTQIAFKDGKLVFSTRTEREGEKAAATFEGQVKGDAVEGEASWEYQGMQGSFRFAGKRRATGPGPPKAKPG